MSKEHKFEPEYTNEPLPEELLFDGYECFLVPIPNIGYENKLFALTQLVPHFKKMRKKLIKAIKNMENLKNESEEALKYYQSQNLKVTKLTKNHINQNFWRLQVLLKPKKVKYSIKLQKYFIEKFSHSLEILNKLKSISEELLQHPRYIDFCTKNINGLSKISYYKYQYRVRAIKFYINDTCVAMKLLPHYLSDEATANESCKTCLQLLTKCIYPNTNYLKESEEYSLFLDFIRCRYSPLRVKNIFDYKLKDRIIKSVELIKEKVGVTDPIHISILGSLCLRYWLDKEMTFDKSFQKVDDKLTILLDSYKTKTWEQLHPPREIAHILSEYSSISEFFQSSNLLIPTPSMLFHCIFFTNPCDIAEEFHNIYLRFAGFMAEKLNLNINHRIVFMGAEFLWKLLLIESSIPGIEIVFQFVHSWKGFEYSPKELFKYADSPTRFLLRFIKEANQL